MLLNDRDQIIAMTAEWIGERYPNGRPRVSDEKIEILKNLTQEEIWQPLYSCGYRFQFQGDLKPLHPDKKLYGRAVTCCFMPQRPDLRQHVFNVARSRGWKGDCNQWVIDSLEESDVVVCDLYDKILRGTFVGGNLTTAVKARTKNGGVVVWGGVRDLEQMQNIDVQVFYRGVDPTPIRDCQITAFNGPCRIGAAICLPGDIVIGTKNGILFVPSHMVDYVIEHAYKSQVRDLYAFPKLEAGIYTTADVDAVVWNDQMMQALLNFIDTDPAAAKYRGLDWSVDNCAKAWVTYVKNGDSHWCFDGYFRKSPSNYIPSGTNYYYCCAASYCIRGYLGRMSRCKEAPALVILSLDTMSQRQNQYGYVPTTPGSEWLQGDYGIGPGFYDTRFNTDLLELYISATRRLGKGMFEETMNRYLAFFSQVADTSHIPTETGGWLIPDYWHPDELTAPHTSLNHQASECLALYHAADLLNRKDLRALADRMLLAIVDTGSGWVMPNHNLYYSIKPDGTYVEGDYPYLTYNDLYDLRKYLSSSERPELETLTYLMGEKLQWMQNNGVTGYEKG